MMVRVYGNDKRCPRASHPTPDIAAGTVNIKITHSTLCDLCSCYIESIIHLVWECPLIQGVWMSLKSFLQENGINIIELTVQWSRQFLGHRQFRVTFRQNIFVFFPNDKVYRYFNYPVIFPNFLAA